MKTYKFTRLLTETGWVDDAYVTVDEKGKLKKLSTEKPENNCEEFDGWAMPGVPNSHSHAFQFAMAGQAEYLPAEAGLDDFWSWRKTMYSLANMITPDQVQEFATVLYKEMAEHGYTNVAEFHYLHHQPGGSPYDSQIEMAERLIASAMEAEISITMIPVYYQTGNFGKEASENQSRFLFKDVENYLKYLDELSTKYGSQNGVRMGFGAHSLRAAPKEALTDILEGFSADAPFHMHISEQSKEVEDCKAFYGARPVEWLLDQFDVNDRFNLIHATHIDDDEISGLVDAKANVVLCPSTEGNLGDGIFPLRTFHHLGGRWSIGSDSQVCRNPFEELRWLDYGQRLTHQIRNPICKPGGPSSGTELLRSAISNGRRACGLPTQFYAEGETFDVMTFDMSETPSTLIFA